MIKNLLIAVMLLLPAGLHGEGWKQHPQFVASGIKNNIDAGNYVYMLVNSNLSRFEKATGDIQMLKKSVGMTEDVPVTQIYYNYDKQYLLVLYLNLNMDVIKSDGTVVNVPALKDMLLQGCDRTVNDVTFDDGIIYVSTGFGYFVIDDTTFTTKEYRNYGVSIRSLVPVSGGLAAAVGDSLYYSRTTSPERFSSFEAISPLGNRDTSVWTQQNKGVYIYMGKPVKVTYAKLDRFNDSRLFLYVMCNLDSAYVKRLEINRQGDSISLNKFQYARFGSTQGLLNFQPTPTGYLWNLLATNAAYYTTNGVGENYKSVSGKGAGIFSCYPAGDGTLWGFGANGLFKNTAATTYYKASSYTLALPYWASYNQHTGRLYMNNAAPSSLLAAPSTTSTKFTANVYDGNMWRDNGCIWATSTPDPVNWPLPVSKKNSSGYRITFDPNHSDTYYVGTWYSGLYKVVNDTVKTVFDETNSPIVGASNGYYRCIKGYGFDSQGNLWIAQNDDGAPARGVIMALPADKLNNATYTADDFITYSIPGTQVAGSKFNTFAIGKDDVKVFCPGDFTKPIVLWRGDLNGEQETKSYTQVTDQKNTQFEFDKTVHPYLTSDSTGLIWVGASCLFYFDPTTGFGDELRVTRPVNANGEFVLEGTSVVHHIEVDYLNRKWVGTSSHGVYLLSADGTEILKHFDTSNSILPSDNVYSICAMGNTGNVMFITSNGVVEYMENYEAPVDLGNLEVYPNPVLPDFTGLVTINGVARGRQVKICNAQGEVLKEFVHDSAILTWDTCTAAGERVETGSYAIYVSNAEGEYPAVPQLYVKVVK